MASAGFRPNFLSADMSRLALEACLLESEVCVTITISGICTSKMIVLYENINYNNNKNSKTTRTSEQYKTKNTLNAKTNSDVQHKEDNASRHSNGKNTNK